MRDLAEAGVSLQMVRYRATEVYVVPCFTRKTVLAEYLPRPSHLIHSILPSENGPYLFQLLDSLRAVQERIDDEVLWRLADILNEIGCWNQCIPQPLPGARALRKIKGLPTRRQRKVANPNFQLYVQYACFVPASFTLDTQLTIPNVDNLVTS